MYKKRFIANNIRESVKFARVIVLSGARQTGKTTLLLNEDPFNNWQYLNLDDPDVEDEIINHPREILEVHRNLIIDEVQRAPDILRFVKMAVDKDPEKRIVLSGSSNLLLMKSVSETLAGRAAYFELAPFSLSEWLQTQPLSLFKFALKDISLVDKKERPDISLPLLLVSGFLPPVLMIKDPEHIFNWWRGYFRTYIERDLRNLSNIASIPDFRRIAAVLASEVSGILNESNVSRHLAIAQPTTHRYISLLETSLLFVKLYAFTSSPIKRLMKSPKIYFIDPGLSAHVAGFSPTKVPEPSMLQQLFENMIFLHLYIYSSIENGDLYYFRSRGGKENEVDFILDIQNTLIPVEVKFKKYIRFRDTYGLRFFMDMHKIENGFIIYDGEELYEVTSGIFAVPWWYVC